MLHLDLIDDAGALVLGPCADSAVERAVSIGGELRDSHLRCQRSVVGSRDCADVVRRAREQAGPLAGGGADEGAASTTHRHVNPGHLPPRALELDYVYSKALLYSFVPDTEGSEGLLVVPISTLCEFQAALHLSVVCSS